MTSKERLIEIISAATTTATFCTDEGVEVLSYDVSVVGEELVEMFVDYLLENNVVVLPCKVGDTVYAFTPFCEICERYLDEELICENCANDGSFVSETKFDYEMIPMINKIVFLTKEEAEQKLESMKGECNG